MVYASTRCERICECIIRMVIFDLCIRFKSKCFSTTIRTQPAKSSSVHTRKTQEHKLFVFNQQTDFSFQRILTVLMLLSSINEKRWLEFQLGAQMIIIIIIVLQFNKIKNLDITKTIFGKAFRFHFVFVCLQFEGRGPLMNSKLRNWLQTNWNEAI